MVKRGDTQMADVAAKVQPSAASMDNGDNVVRVEDLHVNFYTSEH